MKLLSKWHEVIEQNDAYFPRQRFALDLRSPPSWERRMPQLYEIYGGTDIVQRIKKQRLGCLCYVVLMVKNTPALYVFNAVPAIGSR